METRLGAAKQSWKQDPIGQVEEVVFQPLYLTMIFIQITRYIFIFSIKFPKSPKSYNWKNKEEEMKIYTSDKIKEKNDFILKKKMCEHQLVRK